MSKISRRAKAMSSFIDELEKINNLEFMIVSEVIAHIRTTSTTPTTVMVSKLQGFVDFLREDGSGVSTGLDTIAKELKIMNDGFELSVSELASLVTKLESIDISTKQTLSAMMIVKTNTVSIYSPDILDTVLSNDGDIKTMDVAILNSGLMMNMTEGLHIAKYALEAVSMLRDTLKILGLLDSITATPIVTERVLYNIRAVYGKLSGLYGSMTVDIESYNGTYSAVLDKMSDEFYECGKKLNIVYGELDYSVFTKFTADPKISAELTRLRLLYDLVILTSHIPRIGIGESIDKILANTENDKVLELNY